MRDVGYLNWINDYIGRVPYKFGGRDEYGVDCYGLVKLVYAEQYGIELPDWLTDEMSVSEKSGAINTAIGSGDWEEIEEPVDGCFVVCYRNRAAHHLGLYYGGGVLHCADKGPAYEPIRRFMQSYPKIVFGQWTP
jgi:lipoprotein Spr